MAEPVVIATWPTPPWPVLQIVVPISMGLFPVLLFPFSRLLWLALDWTFRPPSRDSRLDHPRTRGEAWVRGSASCARPSP